MLAAMETEIDESQQKQVQGFSVPVSMCPPRSNLNNGAAE